MPPSYFPLRWESTGDQWWFASPIDFAAANGHYDLVRELLHLDTNLLIKLTSLRRIRRLETVWDDEEQFVDVAKCRSLVAKKLLLECESKNGTNSLIRAGYGGWLLYTAASAGDITFVKELLERDPFLVFGEGEYGVTDIFYAAARSKNCEVFRMLLEFSLSSRSNGKGKEGNSLFKWEVMNRAVHAAARGGNVEILKELLGDCLDVSSYRDVQGSTLLHTASARGQIEVVKFLLESFNVIHLTDNQGNTALHVAAYRGYLPGVDVLIAASPSSVSLTNNYGDTFLHMAIAGFRTPGFRRVDRQIELMKQLVSGKIVNMEDIINVKNNDGRTALHMAVIENIHSDLVELLMTVPLINVNIRDVDRMTPLDLLKQRPRSASSEILIKRLISAGGISNYQDYMTRTALVSHLKTHGIGGSPGTSFRVADAEIIFYTGVENENLSDASYDYDTCSGELSRYDSPARSTRSTSGDSRKLGSINSAVGRLRILLRWAKRKDDNEDDDASESYSVNGGLEYSPVPLRQRFMKCSSLLPNNKRIFAARSDLLPSPSTKKKFSAGLMHGVLQVGVDSPSSPLSESSWPSPISIDKQKGEDTGKDSETHSSSIRLFKGGKSRMNHQRQSSLNMKLMNQYFCFGAQGLAAEDSVGSTGQCQNHKPPVLT